MNIAWTNRGTARHNSRVTATIPPTYQSHHDDGMSSTNTSYFVLVGTGTLFGNEEGIHLRNVLDGTSNTLAVVEAKRDVHWAKPEDISWDPDEPSLSWESWTEEGFVAGVADGSVRFVSNQIDLSVLADFIHISDGNVVDFSRQ